MHSKITAYPARILAVIMLSGMASACAQGMSAHPAAASEPCLAPAEWHSLSSSPPRATPATDIITAMARRNVVLLGEQHDDTDHHRWQLQTLAALQMQQRPLIIGFEAFPRRVQPVLDQWIAGELTVKQFLEQSEWHAVWRFPSELYMPLFQFARINRIPMVALNVDQALTKEITKSGWDALPADKKEGVSRPAPPSDAYTDFLYKAFQQHQHGTDKNAPAPDKDSQAFRFFVESQTTWDRAMAEALASRVDHKQGTQRPLVVGIMGGGHVRHGYGVQHQLLDLGISNIGTLLPVDADQDCDELKPGLADAVFALPAIPADKPPPPRLGVRLELTEGSVRLTEVSAGSLAEKNGLKPGDQIISIAGAPVSKIISVVGAVRLQPAGTWLPMEVRRGADTLEFVIKFPPQK